MKVKIEKSNSDQNSLQAKELQRFLNKVEGVMLIPKDKIMGYTILCLVVSEETFANFRDYNLRERVIDLLDDKYPLLSIRVDDNIRFIRLSIIDKESGLTFKLPDQPIGKALLMFLESQQYDDKIR